MRFSATAILSLTTSFGGLLVASCSQQTNAATIVSSTDGVVVRNSIPHSQKNVKESFGRRSVATNKSNKDNTTKTTKNIPQQDDRIGTASAGRGQHDHRHNVRYSNEGILKNPTFHDQSNAILGEQPSSADVGILSVGSMTTTVNHDTSTTILEPNNIMTERYVQTPPTQRSLAATGCTDILSCDPTSYCTPDDCDPSCTHIGTNVVINDGSCNAYGACYQAAENSNAEVDISCYSCNGNNACEDLARDADDSATFAINNSCSQGATACTSMGKLAGANSNFILNYSCNNGVRACSFLGFGSGDNTYFLIENSCNANNSCRRLGQSAGDGSSFVIKDNSCYSCYRMGQYAGAGSSFQIDSYSCNTGSDVCKFLGKEANDDSNFHIQNHSCQGNNACYNIGSNAPQYSNFEIGPQSCIGDNACSNLGRYSQELYIGEGSCLGDYSCFGENTIDGDKALPIHIGIGSCTCDNCCKNLQPGSYISDGLCVSKDELCGNFDGAVIRQDYTKQELCSFPQTFRNDETNLITDSIVFSEESTCDDIKNIVVNAVLSNTETSDGMRIFLTHVLPGEEIPEIEGGDTITTRRHHRMVQEDPAAEAPQVELFNASNFMCSGVDSSTWGSQAIFTNFFLRQVYTGEGFEVVETVSEFDCPGTNIITGNFAVADLLDFIGRSSSGEWILTVEGAESQVILSSWEIEISCAAEEEFACAARDSTACAFSENPNEQFTSFCVLHNNDHFHTDCKRHNIGDEISEIGVGMFLSTDKLVVGCGCCDPNALTVEEYGSAANDVRGTDKSFCVASEPLCTPEDDDGDDGGWDPCDTSGKGKVRKIHVCVDGVTQCLDPFSVFVGGETVTCGVCSDDLM